jgi:hypothetical protein
MHYNLDYALRLCSQNNRMQSCVHIYSQMGLYEEAVSLSLKVRMGGRHFFFSFVISAAQACIHVLCIHTSSFLR